MLSGEGLLVHIGKNMGGRAGNGAPVFRCQTLFWCFVNIPSFALFDKPLNIIPYLKTYVVKMF
jgi:hypothetical protein